MALAPLPDLLVLAYPSLAAEVHHRSEVAQLAQKWPPPMVVLRHLLPRASGTN
jgi:hypothetical protein